MIKSWVKGITRKKKSRLEKAAQQYWHVSTMARHPKAPSIACGEALKRLASVDLLLITATTQRLIRNMCDLRDAIINGGVRRKRSKNPARVVQLQFAQAQQQSQQQATGD